MDPITEVREYDWRTLRRDIARLAERYPFVARGSIGRSVLGRSLSALRWGRGARHILLCAAHHGKEWITSLLLMRFLEILCAQLARERQAGGQGGRRFSSLYASASYHIVPMVNPDGAELCIHGFDGCVPPELRADLLRANGGSGDFIGKWQANARGVDLNHNYDAAFARGVRLAAQLGICGPGPTRYGGRRPESEPESAALARLTRELRPDVCVAYHSQGEVIYADFEGKATEAALRLARKMSRLSGYQLDTAEDMAACSGYKDWVIDRLGLAAYTVEVGKGENPLPLEQFDSILQKNLPMLLFLGQNE